MHNTGCHRARWAVASLAVVILLAISPLGIATSSGTGLSQAEQVAGEFVTAFQRGDWKRLREISAEAALSWVEYVGARAGQTDGIQSITRVESAAMGESIRAKVYFINKDGQTRLRYLKLREIGGAFKVVDDRMMGAEWVSLSYRKGLFSRSQEISGVRVSVIGLLEAPPEVKIDLLIENVSGPETCYVYPSLEAFYVVAGDGSVRQKYFAATPALVPETPLARGASMRTYAIFPFWASDPTFQGKQWKSIEWTLFIPFGPVDQFSFDYM
ncbi:MAG: hypothetical protein ACOYES_00135 [Bacillota bacterium]|jgi:hypothetical protein